jgi:hypothetical protein
MMDEKRFEDSVRIVRNNFLYEGEKMCVEDLKAILALDFDFEEFAVLEIDA